MTIGNPASATGVIAIGAYTTKLCWDYFGRSDGAPLQYYGDYPLDYYDPFTVGGIAYFSSQGPTRDGRTKPDISAPGVGICATLSTMLSQEQEDYHLFVFNRNIAIFRINICHNSWWSFCKKYLVYYTPGWIIFYFRVVKTWSELLEKISSLLKIKLQLNINNLFTFFCVYI